MFKNNLLAGAVINFKGIVQGVGFRPHVYRVAKKYGLRGTVKNSTRGVEIKVDGDKKSIENFFNDIKRNPPVLAHIYSATIEFTDPHGYDDFKIIKSSEEDKGFTPVSPDIATCDECLKEVFDPSNRRYLYPFTNCTNCGPRFTIIESVPYDRKNTTMKSFVMCNECQKEYDDPSDRRYHAQPNACPVCGPSLLLLNENGKPVEGVDPIKSTVELLEQGKIVAIKGLGGYHLALYPDKESSVNRLRERKKRPAKPFALMVRDLKTARKYCAIGSEEEEVLLSRMRPIVLVKRKSSGSFLPASVAPDTDYLGIMLPYTPLHSILLRFGPEILIMTSANISEEPLVYREDEAFLSLHGIADAFLINNREIARPCDDSVVMVVDKEPVLIRRSRGYVPEAIPIDNPDGRQVIAMGPYEKNTFCLVRDDRAYMSHHIGDLGNEKSVDAYIRGIKDFLKMFRCEPEAVICDMHPDYFSTVYGKELADNLGIDVFYVQHHHAHIASVMAEQGLDGEVIGISFDGTGYGIDETVWGGEFLIAGKDNFKRAGYYKPVPMPGGEKAILEIDRMAVSYLYQAFGKERFDIPLFDNYDEKRLEIIYSMLETGLNSPLTSSCGRLFDAVSAILGLCFKPMYDAQGAVLLERAAGNVLDVDEWYNYVISENNIIDFIPAIREVVKDLMSGVEIERISRKFHGTVIMSAVELCEKIGNETGINSVVLSGGSFQNRILLRFIKNYLKKRGFRVFTNRLVPPNDGGLALGQAFIGLSKACFGR